MPENARLIGKTELTAFQQGKDKEESIRTVCKKRCFCIQSKYSGVWKSMVVDFTCNMMPE